MDRRNLSGSTRRAAWALLTAVLAAGPAAGAETKLAYHPDAPELHPNLARGLDIGLEFDAAESASVNLFNGNLVVDVALGQRYPVDAFLTYQLALYYNSRIWDFSQAEGVAVAEPAAFSNAGLGFDLSLGRLLAPGRPGNGGERWLYVSRDGSPHWFYSDLHWDTPDAADPGDAVQYTRDGTYFRLRHEPREKRVEFPSGAYQVFADDGAGGWRLTAIVSRAGHRVDVSYAADGSQWTIRDTHGRVHRVYFADDPAGVYPRLVDRVELAAFGGRRATYDFSYVQAEIPRACADERGGTRLVSLLTGVTDPTGRQRSFEYHLQKADCHNGGRLSRARLEAGGFLAWTYGEYELPPFSCDAPTPSYFTSVSGVVERRRELPDGSTAGRWLYEPVVSWVDSSPEKSETPAPPCAMRSRQTVVSTPLGDKTVYHFAVGTDAPDTDPAALYALPIAPSLPDAAGTALLSREIYDCAPSGGACTLMRSFYAGWEQDEECASITDNCFDTQRRLIEEITYFHDDEPVDSAVRFRRQAHSGYDGLGHFRSVVETSNFGHADYRSVYRSYNPHVGTYSLPGGGGQDDGGRPYEPPAVDAAWFLHGYGHEERSDGAGERLRTDVCYDDVGRLLRVRRRGAAAAASSSDLVTSHSWSGGQVVELGELGGDLQALGTDSDLCALALPTPRYRSVNEWHSGTLARAWSLDADGAPLGFLHVDREIDPDTGLVAVERDSAGLETVFDYDLLGRMTWRRPQSGGGAWIEHLYTPPDGGSQWSSGPRTTTFHRPNGGGAPLKTRIEYLDPFAQPSGTEVSMPGGLAQLRRTDHNALGWKTRESTPYAAGSGATISWTEYLDHDPFGRVGRIVPPEGAQHQVTYEYLGVRESRKTERAARAYSAATSLCYLGDVVTTTTNDARSNPWISKVDRPLPLQGSTVEIETAFDLEGHERRRVHRRTVGVETMERSIESLYDGRGLLLAVLTREEGQEFARVARSSFDARGLPHREERSDLEHGGETVATRLSYDAAGRLVEIADAEDPGRLWKQFVFADDNAPPRPGEPADRSRGRLVSRIRHNYYDTSHFEVEETFEYRGTGGRASKKTVAIRTVFSPSHEMRVNKTYTMEFTSDDLGQVSEIGYPVCAGGCALGEPTAARRVSIGYDQGFTTSISSVRAGVQENWIESIAWGVHGLPSEVRHANGIVEHYEADPYGRALYSSIEVPALDFDSGPFVRDGRGDLCGIGDRSAVAAPVSDLSVLEASSGAEDCTRHVIDPFGVWNGELEIVSIPCLVSTRPYVILVDAEDRMVGALDFHAKKKVFQDGEWIWVPDRDHFTYTWSLWGQDGPLQEVEEHVDGDWRHTLDLVAGVHRLAGKAEASAQGTVRLYYQHPLNIRNTNHLGWPVDPR